MESPLVVVDAYVATPADDTNLRDEWWSFVLDQRVFGPRRLLVAFASRSGRFLSLAYARRTDPPELALEPCILHAGLGAPAAIAYCDEPVAMGPAPPDTARRFGRAMRIAAAHGIHLVDWFACDDENIRSFRLALHPGQPWWDIPSTSS
jgi:hypothetical protein